jgi:sterol 3beta-glucosyltransferase
MKIGLQTWGSDGDVRPMVALANGLSTAGHEVRLVISSVTGTDYGPLAAALDLAVQSVGTLEYTEDDFREFSEEAFSQRDPVHQMARLMARLYDPIAVPIAEASRELCAQNELVVGHVALHALGAFAEKAGRPFVSVSFTPSTIPTRAIPPEGLPNLGGLTNRLGWKLADFLLGRVMLPRVNAVRASLDLPPARSFLRDAASSGTLNLIAASPALCAPMPDWSANHQICGFFDVPQQGDAYQIPGPLSRFLKSGPPPVYMTLGSMLLADPELAEVTRILVEAALQAGCRAIVQSRWDEIDDIPKHPSIFRLTQASHQVIFPHCACVVHHGGSGTSQAATLAGCPSVVVAYYLDQGFWGQCLTRAGISPGLLMRRSLNPTRLAHKLREVLSNPGMKTRAQEFAEQMKAEDGVRRAVELIGEHFAQIDR